MLAKNHRWEILASKGLLHLRHRGLGGRGRARLDPPGPGAAAAGHGHGGAAAERGSLAAGHAAAGQGDTDALHLRTSKMMSN